MRFVEIYTAEVEISIVTLCQFQLETNSRRSKPKLTWLVVSGGRQWVSFSTIQSWQVNCGLDTNPTRTNSWTSLTVLTQHYRISKQTLSLSSSFLLATKNSHLFLLCHLLCKWSPLVDPIQRRLCVPVIKVLNTYGWSRWLEKITFKNMQWWGIKEDWNLSQDFLSIFLHLSSSLEIRIEIRILYVKGLVLRLPQNLH